MNNTKDHTTEEKIKIAARKVFLQKGYDGARTRDIAEEAGINLALLNYYYRSKEKLFQIVIQESIIQLFATIRTEANNEQSSLEEKLEAIVEMYFKTLRENPHLVLFVLGELKSNPDKLVSTIGLPKHFLTDTFLYRQIKEQLEKKNIVGTTPEQIVLNTLSLIIFPFIAQALFKVAAGISDEAYESFLESRKKQIPYWIKLMLHMEEEK